MIIQGLVPPLVTPLAAADQLDVDGWQRLIDHQLAGGVDGLFILGTTGEGPSLSGRLRRELIERTASQLSTSGQPFYVGITDTSLAEAVALAGHAADHGARAVVAAAPYYFSLSQIDLRRWFEELAQQSPLPLILYNMPSCVRVTIEPETLAEMIDNPRIVGLKDSSGDLDYLASAIGIAQARRPGWPVLIGPEALLGKAIALGAVGGVTGGANLCPRLFADLLAAAVENDAARLSQLQVIVDQLQQLYQFGTDGSSYLRGLKCGLKLTGLCSGQLAPPYDEFDSQVQARISQWLSQFTGQEYLPRLT